LEDNQSNSAQQNADVMVEINRGFERSYIRNAYNAKRDTSNLVDIFGEEVFTKESDKTKSIIKSEILKNLNGLIHFQKSKNTLKPLPEAIYLK
jgi:hypothetical protein